MRNKLTIRSILTLMFLLGALISYAEEIFSPDINGLFEAQIICTGRGVLDSGTGQIHFESAVQKHIEVLKKKKAISRESETTGFWTILIKIK